MDLSALERSRLLNSLPSSALGHIGLSALAVSEQSHSSALNRLSAASAAAAAAGASPPDLARAGSPTGGLSPYPGRYLPSSALHSPGNFTVSLQSLYFVCLGLVPQNIAGTDICSYTGFIMSERLGHSSCMYIHVCLIIFRHEIQFRMSCKGIPKPIL